ncbi:unnamed protein product, partial [Cladocopium goreaui]
MLPSIPSPLGATGWWLLTTAAAERLSDAPYMACEGTEVIKRVTWENIHILVDKWPDIDLPHSRVIRKVLWAITHNQMLEEHFQDCGFALATIILVALRAIDYDDGREDAQKMFQYLTQQLLPRLEPHNAVAKDWAADLTDLRIYPFLLGLTPRHDCYGSKLKIFVYDLPHLTRGVLHCHHGQWGLEALIPHWLRQGSCSTQDAE